ncbi:MAG: hypothetical protein K6T83_01825 [Alicyclobacillus sp.]|nr:hypothetical protein [Alicyclobacillus sp.]
MEIQRFNTTQTVLKQQAPVTRKLAAVMSVVAPLLILLAGYRLWGTHTNASKIHEPIRSGKSMTPTKLVSPRLLPTYVSEAPQVTLNYTDYSHYEYTLTYVDKSGKARLVIEEGTMLIKSAKSSPAAVWTIHRVLVQVFRSGQSNATAQFSYGNRYYMLSASDVPMKELREVTASLIESAVKRSE